MLGVLPFRKALGILQGQAPRQIVLHSGQTDRLLKAFDALLKMPVVVFEDLFGIVTGFAQIVMRLLDQNAKLTVNIVEPSIKALVKPVDTLVKPIHALVDSVDTTVKPTDPVVEPIKALVDLVELLEDFLNVCLRGWSVRILHGSRWETDNRTPVSACQIHSRDNSPSAPLVAERAKAPGWLLGNKTSRERREMAVLTGRWIPSFPPVLGDWLALA